MTYLDKKQVNKLWSESNPPLVSLLHCLYEAEDPTLCLLVANLLDHHLNLTKTTLTPSDCLSVGYFLSVVSVTVRGEFRVTLSACFIATQECKFLVQGLCKCLDMHSKITSSLDLDLQANCIKEEGICHITQLLKKTAVVRKLDLSYNSIGEGGLKSLCEALSTNTTLEKLDLCKCLTVSPNS